MIHRRIGKQWLSNLCWGRRGWGRGVANVIFYCFAFSSTFVMNGIKAKSDTLRDFKSFIQANINLFKPSWYLISWTLNFAK